MKKLFKKYYSNTPKKWRKIGDALLAVCLFATSYEVIRENTHFSLAIVIVGIVGKFLTNLFSDDSESKK